MALFTTALGLYGGVLWSGELQGFIVHEMIPTEAKLLILREARARNAKSQHFFSALAVETLALPASGSRSNFQLFARFFR